MVVGGSGESWLRVVGEVSSSEVAGCLSTRSLVLVGFVPDIMGVYEEDAFRGSSRVSK